MNCPSCAAELPPQATICGACGHLIEDPLVGATLNDRYRIQAKLASGGFGSIYRAMQANNNRRVAIKVMHRELSEDANLVARFRREAVALCSLRDSHTVTTYELDETADGRMFIVMELLEGKNLLEVFRSTGPLPWRRMLKIARQVCSALAEAHAHGIIHRDLKPANIFLEEGRGPGDSVKVLDFGIAKIMHGSEIDDGSELTVTGQAVGTLEYMAPEQLMGGACDARTDMYTLGVVVYEIIVGRRPFASASVLDLLSTQLAQKVPKPSLYVPLPSAVTDIMLRCLERDASARYRDVTELAAAIDAVLAQSDMGLLATRTSTARGVAAPRVTPPRRVQSGPIPYLPPGGGTATPPAGTPATPAQPAGFEAPPARRLVDEPAAAAPPIAAGDASYPAMPAPHAAVPAPLRGREASVPVRRPPPRTSPLRITLLMIVLAAVGVGAGVLISQLGI
jgi:tRNA A-37 threonylcarbamoyl transferase component Bud32